MTELRPCESCARHVRFTETACPFCQAALVPATPNPVRVRGRLGRAALMAFGVAVAAGTLGAAGCGDDGSPPSDAGPDSIATPYGTPPADGIPV